MVEARDSACRFAQVGYTYERHYNENWELVAGKWFFWEYDNEDNASLCRNAVKVIWGSPQPNAYHSFKVSRFDSDGHLHLFMDDAAPPCGAGGQGCPETPFDPLNWNNPVGAWFEEGTDLGTDVPGSVSDPTDFTIVETKNGSNDWVSQNWNFTATTEGVNYCAYRTVEIDSTSHFQSFTDRSNC
jgi:hypothetical protein